MIAMYVAKYKCRYKYENIKSHVANGNKIVVIKMF